MIRRAFAYNPFVKTPFAVAATVYQKNLKDEKLTKLKSDEKIVDFTEEKVMDAAFKSKDVDHKLTREAR